MNLLDVIVKSRPERTIVNSLFQMLLHFHNCNIILLTPLYEILWEIPSLHLQGGVQQG